MAWGFLMGAGKGLQGAASSYGRIMDEKRKNDFQLQRDELAFERSKALQDLQFQNQKSRDKTQREYVEDDRELARKRVLEDRAYAEKREGELYERNKKGELEMYEEKKSVDAQYQQQILEQTYDFQKLKTDAERKAVADKMREVFGPNPGTFEQLVILGAETGTNVAEYFKPKEGKAPSAEMVNVISDVLMGNEEQQKLAQENPKAFFSQIPKIMDLMERKGSGSGKVGPPSAQTVLMNITEALKSGKETPDSLRKKASSDEERKLVDLAIQRVQIGSQENTDGSQASSYRDPRMGFQWGEGAKKFGGFMKEAFSSKNTPAGQYRRE